MIEKGDEVTYRGSITEYHTYVFTVTDLFTYKDVECARLQGPKFSVWIERCRVSNLTLVAKASTVRVRREQAALGLV